MLRRESVTLTAISTPAANSYLWNTGSTTQSILVNTGGNYSCTVYSCQDSIFTSPFHLTINPAPPTPTVIQMGTTLYCSTDTSYSTYQWYADNTLINGATDTSLVISKGGNYNVQVTNIYGCKVAVGINVVLGILKYSPDNNYISLFPNPATSQLTIHTMSFHNEEVTVSIMNVLGGKHTGGKNKVEQ